MAKDMDLDALSQMWDAGSCHYYVNELCQLKDGKFIIPICWLEKAYVDGTKTYHADAFAVSFDNEVNAPRSFLVVLANIPRQRVATIIDHNVILINAADLESNYFDLEFEQLLPKWCGTLILL